MYFVAYFHTSIFANTYKIIIAKFKISRSILSRAPEHLKLSSLFIFYEQRSRHCAIISRTQPPRFDHRRCTGLFVHRLLLITIYDVLLLIIIVVITIITYIILYYIYVHTIHYILTLNSVY